MCSPSHATGGVDAVDVRPLLWTVNATATLPKSARLLVNRNTAESVPLLDVALGFAVSGFPVYSAVPVENSDPLVISQSFDWTLDDSVGFQ